MTQTPDPDGPSEPVEVPSTVSADSVLTAAPPAAVVPAPRGPSDPPAVPGPLPTVSRRRWPIPVAVAGILVIASIAAAVAWPGHAAKPVAAVDSVKATPSATPTPTTPPTPASSPASLQDVLDAQSSALLNGDEQGWLAPIDPKAKATIAEYKRIFHNMHAMHVGVWDQKVNAYGDIDATEYNYTVSIDYCLNASDCSNTSATWTIKAKLVSGRATIESYALPKASEADASPLPWEVATLTVATGPRVVVAASGNEASRVAHVLPMVEKAAAADDPLAMWGKPAVYVVYLADHTEFGDWFDSHETARYAVGYALSISSTDIPVVVVFPDAAEYSGTGGLQFTIQHELGHVATLQNEGFSSTDDSLVEGLADYCAALGHPSWESDKMAAARIFVRRGGWSHQIYLTKQIDSTNLITSNGAYAIGYLGLRYLANTYGQAKMLDFFGDVEHYGMTLDAASRQEFGKSWKTVNAAAVKYVEAQLHV